MSNNIIVNILLIIVTSVLASSEQLIIDTPNGKIHGLLVPINGSQTIEMYLGIPYAEPPIGSLRFARPVSKKPWGDKVLNATFYSPACPQKLWMLRRYSFPSSFNNTSEDCLYLNVFVPQNDHHSKLYPVMVWVHGGAYRYGSGSEYDGRILASQGIIVVTINYRLGVLGFLSTDDSAASGNYALLDQTLAFKWVKNNIGSFGGDPDKVTIAGQSAGGGSVSLHMFSPQSSGLFRGVIPQSGCALSPWAIFRPPHTVRQSTMILAEKANCLHSSSNDIVQCLRKKSADLLINTYVAGPPMISPWAPRVDDYFITDLPETLLESGNYTKNVTVMTGTVPNESADEIEDIPDVEKGFSNFLLGKEMQRFSSRFEDKADEVLLALTCEYYSNTTSVTPSINRNQFIEMKSDYGYIAPHIKLAEKLSSDNVTTYFYSFNYRSPFMLDPKWMGVLHATELYFEFGAPFLSNNCSINCISKWPTQQKWTSVDKEIGQQTIDIWSNFVKSLNPDSVRSLPRQWPSYNAHKMAVFEISSSPGVRFEYKREKAWFWNYYIPTVLNGKARKDCHHKPDIITIVG